MKRRGFIAGLAAVATGPRGACAQPKLPVVAFMTAGSLESNFSPLFGRLSRRHGEFGYVDPSRIHCAPRT
jgi:hypothetical protein